MFVLLKEVSVGAEALTVFNYRTQAALLQLSVVLLARNKHRKRVREVLLLLLLSLLLYVCAYTLVAYVRVGV